MSAKKVERWHYAGRRITGKGTLADAYDDGETLLLFKGKGRRVIGLPYDVEVTRTEGGGVTLHGEPRAAFDAERHARAAEWAVADALAEGEVEAKRAELRAVARGGLGDLRLEDLRAEMLKLLPHQRRGLLVYVYEYLLRPGGAK